MGPAWQCNGPASWPARGAPVRLVMNAIAIKGTLQRLYSCIENRSNLGRHALIECTFEVNAI